MPRENQTEGSKKRNSIDTYFISNGNEGPGVQVPRGPARNETESGESPASFTLLAKARFHIPLSTFSCCFPPCASL